MATITERLEAATVSHELAAQRMHDLLDALGPISGSDVFSVEITDALSVSRLGALFGVRPEIETPSQTLAITDNGNGTLTVEPGQTWVWRSFRRFSSDDIDAGERTFATTASRTYHLRWSPTNGFQLKDTTDAAYNPGALAEDDAALDTVLDDMLVARVVTDGVNTPTITPLRNAMVLHDQIYDASPVTNSGENAAVKNVTHQINWAVRPQNWSMDEMTVLTTGTQNDADTWLRLEDVTRYSFNLHFMRDYASQLDVTTHLRA